VITGLEGSDGGTNRGDLASCITAQDEWVLFNDDARVLDLVVSRIDGGCVVPDHYFLWLRRGHWRVVNLEGSCLGGSEPGGFVAHGGRLKVLRRFGRGIYFNVYQIEWRSQMLQPVPARGKSDL
jgi:hypothetical protein